MINTEKKKLYATNLDYLVVAVLTIYFILTLTVPFFVQVTNAYLTMIVIVVLTSVLTLSNPSKYFLLIIPICSIVLLDVLYRFIHIHETVPLFLYGRFIWLLPALLAYFIIYNKQSESANLVLKLTVITLVITSLTSYFGLLNDPMAARIAATISDSRDPLAISINMRNIGGFSIVYMIVAIYPMIVALKKFNVINILTYGVITVSFAAYIFITQYTTALVLFSISTLSVFFTKRYKTYKLIAWISVSIILFFIFRIFLADGFYFLADLVDSVVLTERLSYIGDLLSGQDVKNNQAQIRFDLFENALDTFIMYPFTGVWLRNIHSGSLSGHSFILDTLANYGVLGIIALGVFYRSVYKTFYAPFSKEPFYGYMLLCFIISFILGVFNPIDSLFTVAFIVPLSGYVIDNSINQSTLSL